jgi:hypothetical protein
MMGGQVAQGIYKIILSEELAKMNELTGTITLSSGIQTSVAYKSLMDSLEWTIVWSYDSIACTQMVILFYGWLMKVYTNQTNVLVGSTVVVEHMAKDQAAGLKKPQSIIYPVQGLAYKAHIKSIAVCMHSTDQVEVVRGKFAYTGSDIDFTRIESGVSFLQVKHP